MAQSRVQFYRGSESKYILQNGVKKANADVAFNSRFTNGVFFATDTGVIYVNGKRYGYCNALTSTPFASVEYSAPSSNASGKLVFKDGEDNELQTVELFRMYSGTPEILNVDLDSSNNYKISLNFKNLISEDSSNILYSDDEEKLGVKLGFEKDEINNILKLGSYDASDNFTSFVSLNEGNYLKDTYLKSVAITSKRNEEDTEDVSILRFTWNADINGDNDGKDTEIDIPLNDLFGGYVDAFKNYTINGKLISSSPILTGDDISVGSVFEIQTDEENNPIIEYNVDDSLSVALAKIDYRLSKTASDASVVAIMTDIEGIHSKIDSITFEDIANLKVIGAESGNYIESISSDSSSNSLVVSMGNIADAKLTNYDTSEGVFTEEYSINQAIQNLDESLTWGVNTESAETSSGE